jgi:hypothetical protein
MPRDNGAPEEVKVLTASTVRGVTVEGRVAPTWCTWKDPYPPDGLTVSSAS